MHKLRILSVILCLLAQFCYSQSDELDKNNSTTETPIPIATTTRRPTPTTKTTRPTPPPTTTTTTTRPPTTTTTTSATTTTTRRPTTKTTRPTPTTTATTTTKTRPTTKTTTTTTTTTRPTTKTTTTTTTTTRIPTTKTTRPPTTTTTTTTTTITTTTTRRPTTKTTTPTPTTKSTPTTTTTTTQQTTPAQDSNCYSPKDGILILTEDNHDAIIWKPYSVFVELYYTWSEDCQKFPETWKALAQELKGWNDILVFAAANCAGMPYMCNSLDGDHIEHGVKYFHENFTYAERYEGSDVDLNLNVSAMKRNVINRLIEEQLGGMAQQFPNIISYDYPDLVHLWEDVPLQVKYVFLIIDDTDGVLGPILTIELRNMTDIVIRYTLSDNEELIENQNVTQLACILVVDKEIKSQKLAENVKTVGELSTIIKNFLSRNETEEITEE